MTLEVGQTLATRLTGVPPYPRLAPLQSCARSLGSPLQITPEVPEHFARFPLAGVNHGVGIVNRQTLGVKELLEDYGAAVAGATSAREALDHLGTTPTDILISDIGLPEMGGYELLEHIRPRDAIDGGGIPGDRRDGVRAGRRIEGVRCSPAIKRTLPSQPTQSN